MPAPRAAPARGGALWWALLLAVCTSSLSAVMAQEGVSPGFELAPPLSAASGGFLALGRSQALDNPGSSGIAAQSVGQAEAMVDSDTAADGATAAGAAAGATEMAAAQSEPAPVGELVQGAAACCEFQLSGCPSRPAAACNTATRVCSGAWLATNAAQRGKSRPGLLLTFQTLRSSSSNQASRRADPWPLHPDIRAQRIHNRGSGRVSRVLLVRGGAGPPRCMRPAVVVASGSLLGCAHATASWPDSMRHAKAKLNFSR
jgi:hypothetical protein